ncbi:hypothetical protein EV702DRAFT_976848, partial [Suillus placidus]
LPYRVRWQDLKDLFRRAGTVLRADVSLLGPDDRSRGYGTVLLATAEDAERAIEMLNGYYWQTRVLEVRPDRLGASVDEMGGSLAIRGANGHPQGLGNPYDEITFGQDPWVIFEFVQVTFHNYHLCIFLSRLTALCLRCHKCLFVGPGGRSRGFGTVSFVTEDGAERLFHTYEFNGRPLKVHYDKFSPSAAPGTCGYQTAFQSRMNASLRAHTTNSLQHPSPLRVPGFLCSSHTLINHLFANPRSSCRS